MKCIGEFGVLADDGEKAQCHICGKWRRNLGLHVVKAHSMTCQQYRDEFGLKRTTKLAGTAFKEIQRAGQSERLAKYRDDATITERRNASLTGDQSPSKRPDVRNAIARQSRKPHVRDAVAEAIRRPETRAKIAAKAKGRKPGKETRAKMSVNTRRRNLQLGEDHPSKRPEVKAKISEASKAWWAEHPEHRLKTAEGTRRYFKQKRDLTRGE